MTDADARNLVLAGHAGTMIHRYLVAALGGDWSTAALVAQIVYWHGRRADGRPRLSVEHDGHLWLARRHDQWADELMISADQAKRYAAKARDAGLIIVEYRLFGGMRTAHYRPNWTALQEAMRAPTGECKSAPTGQGNSAPTNTETTTEREEGIFLTEDSGTHELQASPTEPLTLVVPSAKPSGAFTSAVRPALVDILAGGEESLALNGRTGRDAAWVGRCLGMLGRWTNTDADAAIAWLGWWRRSEQWRFRGASPHRWPAAMAAARDAYNDRPAANGQRGPIDLNRRVDFDRPLGGSAGRSRGPIDLDRR